jgi:hypothetical protein
LDPDAKPNSAGQLAYAIYDVKESYQLLSMLGVGSFLLFLLKKLYRDEYDIQKYAIAIFTCTEIFANAVFFTYNIKI